MALGLLRPTLNPFDLKTVLLAKHAQHVVLIHFPIALFIAAVAFDLMSHWTKRRALADAAYYNLLVAAISTLPVLAAGAVTISYRSKRRTARKAFSSWQVESLPSASQWPAATSTGSR